MNEKLYAKRETVRTDAGDEIDIPVVSSFSSHQKLYRELRLAGKSHEDAEAAYEDERQTAHYESFLIIARNDGKLIKVPHYSDDPEIQTAYESLRAAGESHNSADMTITRQGPSIGLCDTTLLRSSLLYNQYDDSDDVGKLIKKRAKEAGISTTGKFYHPGLACSLGDPTALVGSIDDIKYRAKERGWSCDVKEGNLKLGIPADLSRNISQQVPAATKG